MKKYIVLLLYLLTSACAQFIPDPRNIKSTHIEFNKYISMFESMYGNTIGDIPINFDVMPEGSTIGVCVVYSTGHKQIGIDAEYWYDKNTTEYLKIALIFHELGHCVLNREHTAEYVPFNMYGKKYSIPKSLMNPYIFLTEWYAPAMDYYMKELFSPDTSATINNKSDCIEYRGDEWVN